MARTTKKSQVWLPKHSRWWEEEKEFLLGLGRNRWKTKTRGKLARK
jgi:hypothetical protein